MRPPTDDPLGSPEQRAWFPEAVAGLRASATLRELQGSAFWRAHGERVESLLRTIQTGPAPAPPTASTAMPPAPGHTPSKPPAPVATPASGEIRRIVHWNIFKGIALDEIAAALGEHPALRGADLILLNECDIGMARSGNRHVAAELASRLHLHWAFAPNYLELTKGIDEDLLAPGENELGLHGVAILSRAAPQALQACPLPESFDAFAFHEKRYGRRTALLATFAGGWLVASAHLEVRGTPRGRARQMEALLALIEALVRESAATQDPVRVIVIAGDFNTHTFPRGNLARAVAGLLRILATPQPALAAQLREPWRDGREPLFDLLRRHGFAWEGLSDRRPTAATRLARVEETGLLPRCVARRLFAGHALGGHLLALRLDWFAARGFPEDLAGLRATTVGDVPCGPRPSDHLPIVIDIC
jgi:endonuclease/exonuclease/phosphatase family metal-dependent hydrolase